MKRILLIGANSYIGKQFKLYTDKKLNNTIEVDMISATNNEWKTHDFSNYNVVILLAAIVHKNESQLSKELYFKVNHLMAVDIATRAKQNKVEQLIFMSTAAVYGDKVSEITTHTIPSPTTLYGASKLAAEIDIVKLQDENFKVAIIRAPMVYGEGCKGNYNRLVLLAKYALIFPKIENKRSIVHVNNLIKYIIMLIDKELYGYYHPQENRYLNTCEFITNYRKENGKKTILIPGCKFIIIRLCKMNITIKKLFGDFYYLDSLI